MQLENEKMKNPRVSRRKEIIKIRGEIKNLPANAGDRKHVGLIPGSGRSPGRGQGNPLQYLCLEKSHGERSLAGSGS